MAAAFGRGRKVRSTPAAADVCELRQRGPRHKRHLPVVLSGSKRARAGTIAIFILEPLSGLLGQVSKFTIGQTATSIGGDTGGDVLPWGAAFLVMLAWTAAFLLSAALVDRRRDIA
jgi:hypothetical protein